MKSSNGNATNPITCNNNNNMYTSSSRTIMGRRTDAYSAPTANPLSTSLLSTLHQLTLFSSKTVDNYDDFEDELLILSNPAPAAAQNTGRHGAQRSHAAVPKRKPPPLPQPMHQSHAKASQPMCVPSSRNRTLSQGSTGSNAFSPVSSFSSSYLSSSSPSPHSLANSLQSSKPKKDEPLLNEIVRDVDHAASGNMFHKRCEWSQAVFGRLKAAKRNAFNVRTEDEGPYGNDETRCFVLAHFSTMKIRQLRCVLCDDEMMVYDRFPLVDGTMFVAPVNYSQSAIKGPGAGRFIYGVCLACLNGDNEVRCRACRSVWCADAVQVGTLYKYDVLAAWQCCEARSKCAKCGRCVAQREKRDMFFSTYSEESECGWCRARAHHYVKSPSQLFTVNRTI